VGVIRGVLLDFVGTLSCDPPDHEWLREAAHRVGLPWTAQQTEAFIGTFDALTAQPDWQAKRLIADCSATEHEATYVALYIASGLPPSMARALHALDSDAQFHPFFPDAAEFLRALKSRDLKIAIVGNIFFDLRPLFRAIDAEQLIDAFVLSYEIGIQKPDKAIFEVALDLLKLQPWEALMIGDNPSWDGAASQIGITTVVLPPLRERTEMRNLAALLPLLS
jgi:HAD superfamily hydrolase (TIGR01549 family)